MAFQFIALYCTINCFQGRFIAAGMHRYWATDCSLARAYGLINETPVKDWLPHLFGRHTAITFSAVFVHHTVTVLAQKQWKCNDITLLRVQAHTSTQSKAIA